MKRNSKGFTLVELLAAIVILGILIGVSVPLITRLLDNSRNKIYINDAKKLITQAEYKMKASNSEIEKPDEGDCIIISLLYLDSAQFDNPPYDGEYLKENSYVVVKNNGGKLEYAVTLIEKMKQGGYRGVELLTYSQLRENNATRYVTTFKASDLLNAETDVNKAYINERIANGYISNENAITAIYNYPKLEDNSASVGAAGTPKITFASLTSSENLEYNSLEAILRLKVEDKDTPVGNLSVFLSGTSYESATTAISYGSNDTFSHTINFGAAPYNKTYDGSMVKLYIVVKDPQGNTTKKTMTYKIHKNVDPIIDDRTTITKRNDDNVNMTKALVKLIVSDDIDSVYNLKICLKESDTDENFTECSNYQSYSTYFNSNNLYEHQFTCGSKCERDGSTHYLTIFVKDTYGGIVSKKLSYTFSTNAAPTINSLTIGSQPESFTTTSSKNIVVNVNATDDVDRGEYLKVKVDDGITPTEYNYSSQPIYHTINSSYNGSTKNIKVSVIDTEGKSRSMTEAYTLYQNKAPTIGTFTITSANTVCQNHSLCPPELGGSKNVYVNLVANDDIDSANNYENLLVCLGLDENTCDNYSSYSNYRNKNYEYTIPGDYDGSTKTIYAFVKDSYGLITKKSVTYKVYKNQAPVIEYAMLNSKTDGKPADNSLNALFSINAYDDYDEASQLKLQVTENGVVKIDNDNLGDYLNHENNYTLSGTYDGQTRNLVVKVTDSNGKSTTANISYEVYNNIPPTINSINIYNKEIPCKDELYCPIEQKGNYKVYYTLTASDDIDSNNSLQVCVSENETCNNYTSYSNYLDGSELKEMSHTFSISNASKPYDGSQKHLYVNVKDSSGAVTTQDYVYNLYNNKGPAIIEGPELISNAGGDGNIPNITYSIVAEDDIDETFQIKYCYKKNGGSEVCTNYENYQASKVLDNTFFNATPPNGETYLIYAKLKDSYDKVTTAPELSYKLINDMNPSIFYSNIIKGTRITSNGNTYTRLKVEFSVDDPYDKFQVCVSENESTCTNYNSQWFTANNCSVANCAKVRTDYSIEYDKPGAINEGDHIELYLFVKDSYGNVSSETLYSGDYQSCKEKDEEDASYEYEFNSSLTNSELGHTQPISIDRCGGQCYYYDPIKEEVNEIFSYYKTKIKYTDKFNSDVVCNNGNYEISSNMYACDFKDCFYKNNNYNRYAIGTTLIHDSEVWTANINGHDYSCDSHYKLYLSSYTTGNREITLTPTNTRICKSAFDAGEYDYSSTATEPYVRIVD